MPRKIILMVPAGSPVDSVIDDIKPFLTPGDILIDCGNSHFKDTERRFKDLNNARILYLGCGVSGGEEGALWGPAIMPGGASEAWPAVEKMLKSISARAEDGSPCCEWIGPGGAGHFVKMVHNGIEYADMQMICESYNLMSQALGLSPADMQETFSRWNEGELNSYLIEITAHIMAKVDSETGKPMIDVILDTAGQKGTGKWTSQIALDLGVPAPTIAEAVFARTVSGLKEERVVASTLLRGPRTKPDGVRQELIESIRKALYASKICSYAQGFQLLRAASAEFGFKLKFGEIASIWRAGCIIRAQFLSRIKEAYDRDPDLANLLLDSYFRNAIEENQSAWREVVSASARWGIPIPAFSSALAYYDSYRSKRLPANLLQAQRDYFGAHTFERLDRERGTFFHVDWTIE
jgi:6-phosphogluconate dehydrogenase